MQVKGLYENGTEVPAYMTDEIKIYVGKGNWDVHQLLNYDTQEGVAAIGPYLRTEWHS